MKQVLFILLVFISFQGIAQGVVVERWGNVQKKLVVVYSGTGINEIVTKKYQYAPNDNKPEYIWYYSPLGWVSKREEYRKDDNGTRYLSEVYASKDGKSHTRTYYNPDGTKKKEELYNFPFH